MVDRISGNLSPNSYGNVMRAGNLPNGRVMYNVIDSEGNQAGRLSIPLEQVDTFETSYKQILESAPKIQAYVKANSSQESINKRRNIAQGIIVASGVIGAGLPLFILRKSTSVIKKVLGMVIGVVTGLSIGFVSSLGVTALPGSFEFAKAKRTLSTLDIKPVFDEVA